MPDHMIRTAEHNRKISEAHLRRAVKTTFVCRHCKKVLILRPSQARRKTYCTYQCSVLAYKASDGRKVSSDLRRKLSLQKRGTKNVNWKGNQVGYSALHEWVKYRLPKPNACQDCHKDKPLDLANISQDYNRNISDWEWLCRSCHMKKDGRLEKLLSRPPLRGKDHPRYIHGKYVQ